MSRKQRATPRYAFCVDQDRTVELVEIVHEAGLEPADATVCVAQEGDRRVVADQRSPRENAIDAAVRERAGEGIAHEPDESLGEVERIGRVRQREREQQGL